MKVEDLAKFSIPEKYIQKFKEEKISELYRPQADVVNKGLFKERNLILSLPTASGKTFIATIAMLYKLLEKRQKVVYISPLVALTYEKYEYFKKFFEKDYKVAISSGDLDSSDPWLTDYDIICVTTEKLESLLRHNVGWISRIGLVVVDEIHLLNDPTRGPTLEILLTKLQKIIPRAQLLGLSATISNADELTKWLNADLVLSDFRPVKLYEGIAFDSKIHFFEKSGYEINDSEEIENAIIENTLNLNKQSLIFTSTRKNAESLAEKLCKTVKYKIKKGEHFQLESLSNGIENILEYSTQQCKKIAKCVRNGVAFHHAGLLSEQKKLIENNFRNGLIKTIVATPTLAYGVNLPAFRVIIRDAKRYYSGIGSMHIPVLEYKQFVGRAGRPQYDSFGESVLIAKSEQEVEDLTERFIFGQPEKITSKLAIEPALRMHTLSLVASEFCNSEDSLLEFFNKTFYAFHYGDISVIEEKIIEILEYLINWGFINKKHNKLISTRIGKRVSELYIDPLTAYEFIKALKNTRGLRITDLGILQVISNSMEMKPLPSVRSSELSEIEETITGNGESFLSDMPEEYDLEFEDFVKAVKLTLMFLSWSNEATEDQILVKYRITPGELRGRLELADWLIYALQELTLLQGHKETLNFIRKLRVRMKYGIKEELMPLVKLKNIGRIRSRRLFNAGLTSLDKLRKIPLERLSEIVGVKTSNEIKKQLGGKKLIAFEEKQSTLNVYR